MTFIWHERVLNRFCCDVYRDAESVTTVPVWQFNIGDKTYREISGLPLITCLVNSFAHT